jgi:hypothetical protein
MLAVKEVVCKALIIEWILFSIAFIAAKNWNIYSE